MNVILKFYLAILILREVEIKLAEKIIACNKYFTWNKEQIAKYCKVSVETVKRVLNNKLRNEDEEKRKGK